MKKHFFFLFLFIGSLQLSLFSQTPLEPSAEMEWRITSVANNVSGYYSSGHSFEKGFVYLSESEAVVPVEYTKKTFGLVRLNKSGKTLWQMPLNGRVIGTGKWKANVIVFYDDNEPQTKKIYAALIDPANGKKLQDKLVFENKSGMVIESKVQLRPSGVFNDLLIRTTERTLGIKVAPFGFGIGNMNRQAFATTRLEALYLNDNLDVDKKVTIASAARAGNFLGSTVNGAGDIFICTVTEGLLIVEQFDAAGSPKGKLQTPFSYKFGNVLCPAIALDNQNDRSLLLALHYFNDGKDRAGQLFRFDLSAKKVSSSGEEVLNKKYVETIDLTEGKGIRTANMKVMEDLEVVDIVQTNDKVVVLKAVMFSKQLPGDNTASYFSNAIVISFYDRNAKAVKKLGLNKTFVIGAPGCLSPGFHLQGDKLLIATGALATASSYANMFSSINTSTMKVEQFTALDNGRLGRQTPFEAAATLWFGNTFLLNHLIPKGKIIMRDVNTVLQVVNL